MPEFLLLVTGDHRPRESAVTVPTARFMARVTTRHPPQELPVVDDEVRKVELMGVEDERRDTERHDGEPEVDEVRRPDGHRSVEEHQDVPHAHVDTWSSEPRVEDGEGQTSRRETTTRRNVPGTTECQVALDRLRVDLRREDFEDRRQRQEVLPKTHKRLASTTLKQFCGLGG